MEDWEYGDDGVDRPLRKVKLFKSYSDGTRQR